jgi:hypothetical protein
MMELILSKIELKMEESNINLGCSERELLNLNKIFESKLPINSRLGYQYRREYQYIFCNKGNLRDI